MEEKKEPKKVKYFYGTEFECPNCKKEIPIIKIKPRFCSYCGQRLKW